MCCRLETPYTIPVGSTWYVSSSTAWPGMDSVLFFLLRDILYVIILWVGKLLSFQRTVFGIFSSCRSFSTGRYLLSLICVAQWYQNQTYPPADFLAKLNNTMVPVRVFFLGIRVWSKIPFLIRIFVSSACMHRALTYWLFCGSFGRVSEAYSFNTDPDPAFYAEYRSGSGSRVIMTKNWKNLQLEKNVRTPKLQKKPSALQNMKFHNFFYFCGSFLPSWTRIRSGSGSETLLWE